MTREIERRVLGTTGIEVPVIALGTVKIGRNQGVKYPSAFDLPDDHAVEELLNTARDLGVNLIDTAPAYGTSEERLGQLMPGLREDWVICSKAGENFESGTSSYDFTGTAIRTSVENSLRRLKTDYLDLVLIHSDGNDLDIIHQTDTIPVLASMKDKGLIRGFGLSGKTVEGGLQALPLCDVVMVTLNVADKSQLPVIEAARDQNKGVLLKKVFASGHADPKEGLRYVLNVEGVHCAVIGTLNPQHLTANVGYLRGL